MNINFNFMDVFRHLEALPGWYRLLSLVLVVGFCVWSYWGYTLANQPHLIITVNKFSYSGSFENFDISWTATSHNSPGTYIKRVFLYFVHRDSQDINSGSLMLLWDRTTSLELPDNKPVALDFKLGNGQHDVRSALNGVVNFPLTARLRVEYSTASSTPLPFDITLGDAHIAPKYASMLANRLNYDSNKIKIE